MQRATKTEQPYKQARKGVTLETRKRTERLSQTTKAMSDGEGEAQQAGRATQKGHRAQTAREHSTSGETQMIKHM